MKTAENKMVGKWWFLSLILLFVVPIGCGPALVGGGAAGGYKVGSDERNMGGMVDDTALSANVKTALAKSPDVSAAKIDVDVVGGVVTLTGVVDGKQHAARAVEIAGNVSGVKSVRDNLQIGKLSAGDYVDDAVLVSKIKAKLMAEPGVHSLNIDVDADKGVVTLTGMVENEKEKSLALSVARSVEGVVQVVDNLETSNP
ncbi:MAG: BON domain-containing protein [Desulfococcus multivorans]|jgi:hyperosmotically inducible protein|nr:BON domain-containing protein [Desulfococcus multivorans]